MSQFSEDLATLEQRAEDAKYKAAEALEFLRIRQAFPRLQLNEADQMIIRDYFDPEMVTLAKFVEAFAIEKLPGPTPRLTLREMLCPPKTPAQVTQELRNLPREELKQRVFEEQQVRAVNQKHPVVPQVEPGTPILPLHWDKKLVKRMSNEEIRSARIRFEREHGVGSL